MASSVWGRAAWSGCPASVLFLSPNVSPTHLCSVGLLLINTNEVTSSLHCLLASESPKVGSTELPGSQWTDKETEAQLPPFLALLA